MIYAWREFMKDICKEIIHLFRALTCKRVIYYKKWETPPKFKNKGIITTCVGVPMALIEDESQMESEDVE